MTPTPSEAGFRMPAEWEPHAACWMAWPSRPLWNPLAREVYRAFARLARAIARCEPVVVTAQPSDVAAAAELCGPAIREVVAIPADDLWIRDTGPTFLVNARGELAGSTWRFNAWGEKQTSYADDAALGSRVLDGLGVPRFEAPLVNEGGAFHVDGEGTLLTTESVLLHRNRNPGRTRQEIEELLLAYTGCRKVIWLPGSPLEKVTDGHIDGLACFTGPARILAEVAESRDDPEYDSLQENVRALRRATDAHGRRLEVTTVARPPWNELWSEDFAMSYLNFYLANGAVIMPRFGYRDEDAAAREIIAAAFPERDVVSLNLANIFAGGGGIHCVTLQQPVSKIS
jgi:agmatine deiminase